MGYLEEFNVKSASNLKDDLSGSMIVVFGASNLGEKALRFLKKNKINVDYFCDNNKQKWNKEIEDVTIISIDKLSELSLETNIIIASMYYNEIYCQLAKIGFKNIFYYYNRVVWDEYEEEHHLSDFICINEINKEIEKSKKLKDSQKGKRSFLLATGPSIKSENLKQMNDEDSYSISNFFLHEDIDIIKPKIHFFAPYHTPLILLNYIEWLKKADEMLPESTAICLEISTKRFVEDFNLFSKRTIYYLKFSKDVSDKNIDLDNGILMPQSGPIMIIPFLIYMGYSKIYLLGCDCNTIKDYGKNINNFYNREEDTRKNSTSDRAWIGIVECLESEIKMFLQYQFYKEIAVKKHVLIENLSRDSWLDIFEKNTFENVIKKIRWNRGKQL